VRREMIVVVFALVGAACGGDGGDSGPAPEPAQLAFTAQPSVTTLGQAIAPPVQVSIQDASGNLVANAVNPVTLALGTSHPGGALGGTTTVSAVGGVATFSDLQISPRGAGYNLQASAAGLSGATSATFDVLAPAGEVARIDFVAGDGQTVEAGHAVPTRPSVKVIDVYGMPVAGTVVTFSAGGGDGTVEGSSQTTDAGGLATVGGWTPGPTAGPATLIAATTNGQTLTFTATVHAGPAGLLSAAGGDLQIASIDNAVVEPPAVIVTDAYGNAVAGIPVTFTVKSGGGSLTGGSQTSGSDGVAAVESWILGGTLGPNTLEAASPGLSGSPVVFHATAVALGKTATVEVHSNYFLSQRNGSGGDTEGFGTEAVDTIGVGGAVTWTWVSSGHNVTPYGNTAFAGSGTQSAPFTYGPITFDTPGTYYYRCTLHSTEVWDLGLIGMRGRVVVR
jgi:plastocyanin